jgi:hypothetical protein
MFMFYIKGAIKYNVQLHQKHLSNATISPSMLHDPLPTFYTQSAAFQKLPLAPHFLV